MPPQLRANNNGVTPPKSETKVLSLLLKVIIMTLITSLFLLFLGLATALLLLHLCLASRALRRRRRRHTNFPVSSSGFSTQDLNKLSQFRFDKRIRPQSQSDCVVCLESFRDSQWCRELCSCRHVFHSKCVDTWLVKVPSCPICRTLVRFEIGGSSSGSVMGGAEEDESKEFWGFGRFVSC